MSRQTYEDAFQNKTKKYRREFWQAYKQFCGTSTREDEDIGVLPRRTSKLRDDEEILI